MDLKYKSWWEIYESDNELKIFKIIARQPNVFISLEEISRSTNIKEEIIVDILLKYKKYITVHPDNPNLISYCEFFLKNESLSEKDHKLRIDKELN